MSRRVNVEIIAETLSHVYPKRHFLRNERFTIECVNRSNNETNIALSLSLYERTNTDPRCIS
jgi:hypothetical protein